MRPLLLDAGIVAAVSAVAVVVPQRWAGLDTPDSSFYASLGLFGAQVTDRAVIPSYYSTRLGEIVPVHTLTGLLGTWPGLAVYRALLVVVIVASLYLALRTVAGRPASAVVTALLAMNTVVLTFLGNPYVTATVLAGTLVVASAALRRGWVPAAVAGLGLGWLVMTHPPGALLAGSLWVAIGIHQRVPWRHLPVTAAGAAVSFAALWLAGRVVFPGVDWLQTYLEWNAKLNYASFASADAVWLRDISLLVPLVSLVASVASWALDRRAAWAQLAVIVSATGIGFYLVFSPLMGGVPLEAPMYQAPLWIPSLLALGLLAAGRLGEAPWSATSWVAAAAGLVVVIAAGFWPGAWPMAAGALVALVMVLLLAAGIGSWTRVPERVGVVVVVAALALCLAGAQGLQNSRRALGLYQLSPYSNAFRDNPVSEKLHTAVNAQEWLLARTTAEDSILNWVQGDWVGGDRELYVVAAMQLWGENRVTLEPTVGPDAEQRLRDLRPSVVQMVGQTMDGVLAFWSSLPADTHPTAPDCYDFAWPDERIPQGHSCLTRLTWAPAP